MLERLRGHAETATAHTTDISQHEAFVELLVAAIYADHRVTQDELDAIDTFDANHPDWDDAAFSTGQYFGPAVAKVRRARSTGGIEALVADIGARISDPQLRATALGACADLLSTDGSSDQELAFLRLVGATLT